MRPFGAAARARESYLPGPGGRFERGSTVVGPRPSEEVQEQKESTITKDSTTKQQS